ncbi:ribonuclease P [Candidatus Thorarchaeota archaeon]|jgi:ribonuclease P protein subunit RPR2|nr:MAG: ribonuclease P [Candidatus Thorarchaeota archaeon]
MPGRRRSRREVRRIAEERIRLLWAQAQEIASENPSLARSMMQTARKVAQKARMKLPREMTRRICKGCGTVLIPGQTCRVRVRTNRARHVVVTCLECGAIQRYIVERQA